MGNENNNTQKASGVPTKMAPVTKAVVTPGNGANGQGIVEKKVIVPEKAAVVPTETKVVTASESKSVTQISEFLARYKANLDSRRATSVQQKIAADYLFKAISTALANPTDEVFNTLWTFFTVNKNGLMREDRALQGITSLEKRSADLVMTVYNAFRFFTTNGSIRPSNSVIMSVTRSQRLISYLQRKEAKKI